MEINSMAIEALDLTCPKCGGNMEPDRAKGILHCPYCGHEVYLEPSDSEKLAEKAYARQKGILQANEEAEKRKKRKKIKVRLMIAAVILGLIAVSIAFNALQPKTNPFKYISVEFSGVTGDGDAEIAYIADKDDTVNPREITYRISPQHYLKEGDTVTVTAESSTYHLSPKSHTYTVEGLDTYLTDLNALSDKAMEMIHNKSDGMAQKASYGTKPTTLAPYIVYLATDGKDSNALYDVYRATYKEKDGSFSERFVVVYYTDVIVRDTEEPTMQYHSTMYTGEITELLDKSYGGYMTGYKTLKAVKADILANQRKAITLQERQS